VDGTTFFVFPLITVQPRYPININSFIRQRKGTIHAHELEALAWRQVLSQPEREHALNDLYIFDVQSGETFCGIGRQVTHWFGVVEGLLKVSSDSAEGQTMTFVGVPPRWLVWRRHGP